MNSTDPKDLLEKLKEILAEFKKHGISPTDAFELATTEARVPLSVFATERGPLESLIIHLRDEQNVDFKDIASLLIRSYQTVWTSYRLGTKKKSSIPDSFGREKALASLGAIQLSDISIPLSIFKERKLSIYESLVKYLRERRSVSLRDIGALIGRDERTIWTIYHRAKSKVNTNETT